MMTLVLIVATALALVILVLTKVYIASAREWDALEAKYRALTSDVSRRRSDCVSLNAQLLEKISEVNSWAKSYKRLAEDLNATMNHNVQLQTIISEQRALKPKKKTIKK